MKKIFFLILLLLPVSLAAQEPSSPEQYNRASIYPIYALHNGTRMFDELYSICQQIPVPDKYNDHRLSVWMVQALPVKTKNKEAEEITTEFIQKNEIAKRLVAKWFDRDKKTGVCNTDLISERAAYDVSAHEAMQARYTITGKPVLPDADIELIPNTFVLISDISYVDKEEQAQKAMAVLNVIGQVAQAAAGISSSAGSSQGKGIADMTKSLTDLGSSISDMVAGFTVDITTYLFQLKWNEEIANTFYLQYYGDSTSITPERKRAFDADKTTFTMELLGSYSARSDKAVLKGLHTPADVFRKVLTRAQDKNIVALQRKFPQFKVTDVISAVLPGNQVQVQIGLKEGVNEKSRYEVLERVFAKDGQINYVRRATIKPVPTAIWDNRYMAVEEEAENATLGSTLFEFVSGDRNAVYAGMLVREIR